MVAKRKKIIILSLGTLVGASLATAAWVFTGKTAAHSELVKQVAEDLEDCVKSKEAAPNERPSPLARCVIEEGVLLTQEFGAERAGELIALALEKKKTATP